MLILLTILNFKALKLKFILYIESIAKKLVTVWNYDTFVKMVSFLSPICISHKWRYLCYAVLDNWEHVIVDTSFEVLVYDKKEDVMIYRWLDDIHDFIYVVLIVLRVGKKTVHFT